MNASNHDRGFGRRSVLKGAGVSLAGLGGLTETVAAKGKGKGVRRLTDRGADILVFWSNVDAQAGDPDQPGHFGYPIPGSATFPMPPAPTATGGVMYGGHDPADGGMFDFSRIKMMPNGDLQNKWVLFGGAVLQTGPRPYSLIHLERGKYQSRDQEMSFIARSADEIASRLGLPEIPPMLAPLKVLAGGKWYAVGTEFAQLATDDQGKPDPTMPEWGATRIDIYDRKSMEYTLSLIYLIGADDTGSDNPNKNMMDAFMAGLGLIDSGRLDPAGR